MHRIHVMLQKIYFKRVNAIYLGLDEVFLIFTIL